jgi:hypothetical protein
MVKAYEKMTAKTDDTKDAPKKDKSATDNTVYSMMDGVSGDVCLLTDLLNDERYVRFPGYEI